MKKSILKKTAAALLCAALLLALAGCARGPQSGAASPADDGVLDIVTTIFPPFDFARSIGGAGVRVTQLLPPGAESHSYEPTAQDILAISRCDLFIYVGGENDTWVEDILASFGDKAPATLTLLSLADVLEESDTEGMQSHEAHGAGAHEIDEHVWTSPKRAVRLVQGISDRMQALDPADASVFRANTEAYLEKLYELDALLTDTVANAARRVLVFGDRFPFRYLAEDYGLECYAAFPGCSAETEPSAATVAFLCDKIEQERLPAVLYIEFSNHRVADAVAEATGVKTLLLHSCHNVSRAELDAGEDYISLMTRNAQTLREALG